MTFPEIDAAAQTPAGQTRLKRQLAEHAIAQRHRRRVGGRGRDQPPAARARCRLRGREPARQGAVGARRARLGPRALPGGARPRPDQPHRRAQHRPPQGPPRRRRREDRPGPGRHQGAGPHLRRGDRQDRLRPPHEPARSEELAQVNPGDLVELIPEGNRLIANSNGVRIGIVEPRVAARLLKLIADGNKYLAGVTSLGDATSA